MCLLGIERHMRIRKAGVDIPPALIPALIAELEAVKKKKSGARAGRVPYRAPVANGLVVCPRRMPRRNNDPRHRS